MGRPPTRRRFLRATVAGGLTVTAAGCIAGVGREGPGATETGRPTSTEAPPPTETAKPTETSTPRPPPESGAVAFVYDDGRMADYEKALPVHREFDAPATSCILSGYVGRKQYMDVEHVQELSNAGWEIGSHTVKHKPVDAPPLVADVGPSDTRLYAEHVRHGHHEGTDVQITDGDRSVRRTVKGLARDGDDTRYIELESSVGESFKAGGAVVRYPPDVVEESLAKSKRDLEALGLQVDSFLAPYDKFDDYSMQFVPDHYDYVANARPGSRINRPQGFDPYATRRDYYIEFTSAAAVEADLDEIAATGALGVFGAHPAEEAVTQAKIRETLGKIEERGIEVLTLREACRRYAASGSGGTSSGSGTTSGGSGATASGN